MTDEIRVVIFEDDELWLRGLSAMLDESGYTVAGMAKTFAASVSLLNSAEYDIALVDVSLEEKNNGLELGQMISRLYKKPYIYITSNQDPDIIAKAVVTGPSAYLLKPVQPSSLIGTLQSAINNFNERRTPDPAALAPGDDLFFVKQGTRYKKLHWADIAFLRSERNYTAIFNSVDKTEYFIRSTLSKTMSAIIHPAFRNKFALVNRAEAVQVSFISELAGDEVRTNHGTFTLTDTYTNDLKRLMHVII